MTERKIDLASRELYRKRVAKECIEDQLSGYFEFQGEREGVFLTSYVGCCMP